MLGVIFEFGTDIVEVRVGGNHVVFRNATNPNYSTIDNLQLSYTGVCKEFPDLKDSEHWRVDAIARFKTKIAELESDEDKMDYIVTDLSKHGYIPKFVQKGGHRVKRIKNDKWTESL